MTAIRDAGEQRIEVDCHDQNVDEVYQNCAHEHGSGAFSYQFLFISLTGLEHQGKNSCADRCP